MFILDFLLWKIVPTSIFSLALAPILLPARDKLGVPSQRSRFYGILLVVFLLVAIFTRRAGDPIRGWLLSASNEGVIALLVVLSFSWILGLSLFPRLLLKLHERIRYLGYISLLLSLTIIVYRLFQHFTDLEVVTQFSDIFISLYSMILLSDIVVAGVVVIASWIWAPPLFFEHSRELNESIPILKENKTVYEKELALILALLLAVLLFLFVRGYGSRDIVYSMRLILIGTVFSLPALIPGVRNKAKEDAKYRKRLMVICAGLVCVFLLALAALYAIGLAFFAMMYPPSPSEIDWYSLLGWLIVGILIAALPILINIALVHRYTRPLVSISGAKSIEA